MMGKGAEELGSEGRVLKLLVVVRLVVEDWMVTDIRDGRCRLRSFHVMIPRVIPHVVQNMST